MLFNRVMTLMTALTWQTAAGVEIEKADQILTISGISGGIGIFVQAKGSDDRAETFYDETADVWQVYVTPGKQYTLTVIPLVLSWVPQVYAERAFIAKAAPMKMNINLFDVEKKFPIGEKLEKHRRDIEKFTVLIRGAEPGNAYYTACAWGVIESGSVCWGHRVSEPGKYEAFVIDTRSAKPATVEKDALQSHKYTVDKKELKKTTAN